VTALTAAIGFTDTEQGRTYKAWLIPEDGLTDGDDRLYVGPIGWRAERIPLTFSDVEGEPHEEARHVGNLDNLRREMREGESWLVGDVDWDDDELALEAKRLVDEDRLRGISVHPTEGDGWMICGVPDNPTAESIEALAQEFDMETCERPIMAFTNVVVGAATLLLLPAFEDAEVVVAADTMTVTQPAIDFVVSSNTVTDTKGYGVTFTDKIDSDGKPWIITMPREDAESIGVLAAADLVHPRADWFEEPDLDGPTYVTVTDEGRVFGTLAPPDVCHRGFADACVLPPMDAAAFEEFHDNASVVLDNGKLLRVGCLTVDVGHADVRASSERAKRHYDDSGTVVAFVRAGQNKHGIWVAGALAPWATEETTEKLKRMRLSGDWRPTRDGRHFLIAAQVVPVPGFPIRAKVAGGMLTEYTTLSPAPPDAIAASLETVGTEALIAAALGKLDARLDFIVDWIREQERREAYARSMAVLDPGVTE
jgi:hypothetical protein